MYGTNRSVYFIHILTAASLASRCLELYIFFIEIYFFQSFQFKDSDKPVASFMKLSEGTFPGPAYTSQPAFQESGNVFSL